MEVSLIGIEFIAPHGVYEEEQLLGNRFIVDIIVKIPDAQTQDELKNTLDYTLLYQYAAAEMKTPARLLESIANGILNRIFRQHEEVIKAEVMVAKLFPPVGGRVDRAVVRVKRKN
jgi:dihydroneopterin aldolase